MPAHTHTRARPVRSQMLRLMFNKRCEQLTSVHQVVTELLWWNEEITVKPSEVSDGLKGGL